MTCDVEAAKKVFEGLGIPKLKTSPLTYKRHPLSFVMEAADDIAYLTTDIEDGFKAQLIPFKDAESLLRPIGEIKGHLPRYSEIATKPNNQDKIAYLRAGAISSLMLVVIGQFEKRYDSIMSGEQPFGLLQSSESVADKCKQIRSYCEEHLYTGQNKLRKEAAGYNVIFGLMDMFGGMFSRLLDAEGNLKKLSMIDQNLFNLLPSDDGFKEKGYNSRETFAYLVDYISGMTDQYALELYQKLSGHSPTIQRMI